MAYNPNQDIVAGRTAKQIEAAKRRAVKGGGRKRCKKGKSCGATCINGGKVCLVDLPWVASQGLTKVAKGIQSREPSSAPSKTPPLDLDQLKKEVGKSISDIQILIPAINYAKGMAKGGDEYHKDKLRVLLDKLKSDTGKTEAMIGKLPPGKEKDMFTRRLGLITGKVKGLPPSSLEDIRKAGKEFMDKYRSKLNSAMSILRRADLLERSLEERIKNPDISIKERLRLKKALLRMRSYSIRADERSFKLMGEMRKELLNTKLSNKEIQGILSRLNIVGGNIPADSPLFGQVRSQIEEFARMFNGKGLLETVNEGVIGRHLQMVEINAGTRAFASMGFISTNGNRITMFHEIGHIVEGGRPWLERYATQWRDGKAYTLGQINRTPGVDGLVRGKNGQIIGHATQTLSGKDLPVFRLAEMPIHKNGGGYDPNEIALVDKFVQPYMGKVYVGGATEVISMAMERFTDAYGMQELYKAHPDLFEVIAGLAVT